MVRGQGSGRPGRGRRSPARKNGRSAGELVLPEQIRELLRSVGPRDRHPGLQLDKFSAPGEQKQQGEAIEHVCQAAGDSALLNTLAERRAGMLDALGARRIRARTTGPLTLQLARASGLENAGIHLHPVYGFCCLPGSGIKGMTRAWAETVWKPEESDSCEEAIVAAFGRASERGAPNGSPAVASSAGALVFHDAWPLEWPRLERDIVNNHHQKYYGGDDDPGDWEDPAPVYFIAVPAGVEFDFAVSLRLPGADCQGLLEQAVAWLAGALLHEGAGAKTNAGYGRFELLQEPEPPRPERARRVARHTLTLATPGFLAGARQNEGDCDLRPATLRGLLRWWWRTMHAQHLGRKALLELETSVWGSAKHGAALALSLRRSKVRAPRPFAYKDGFKLKGDFAREHGISSPSRKGVRTTIQGLFYASYGMADGGRQRWYVPAGAEWQVTLSARDGRWRDVRLPAEQVLKQAQAALWLLCRHGAVGSKARKGFGSLNDIDLDWVEGRDDCVREAADLRSRLEIGGPEGMQTPSLEEMRGAVCTTRWTNEWYAMDQVGAIYQDVVKAVKAADRAAFGLPRRNAVVRGVKRHASPLHWSLSRSHGGTFQVRLSVFPAPKLEKGEGGGPSQTLNDAFERAKKLLEERAKEVGSSSGAGGPSGPRGGRGGRRRSSARQPSASPPPFDGAPPKRREGLPRGGDRVDVNLIEEKTKKGGWKFRHEATGLEGSFVNSADVPSTAMAGQAVPVIVQFANEREMSARWPEPGDPGPKRAGGPKSGGPGRRRSRR